MRNQSSTSAKIKKIAKMNMFDRWMFICHLEKDKKKQNKMMMMMRSLPGLYIALINLFENRCRTILW